MIKENKTNPFPPKRASSLIPICVRLLEGGSYLSGLLVFGHHGIK